MNLTLSIEDELVEKAREVARQHGMSLNAMIREYIERLAGHPQSGKELLDEFERMWAETPGDSGGWKFDRDEIYAERLERSKTRK